jgi:hypothetical protein
MPNNKQAGSFLVVCGWSRIAPVCVQKYLCQAVLVVSREACLLST